ncbi:MAG: DUF1987 domain-containing protein [Vicingaceae bacterium]|nr:DUF1987 domain-containing protein [Vicingaceae bacterium]
MATLYIEQTHKTPEIDFNLSTGKLSISGVSVPENAHEFYFPIIEWLQLNMSKSTCENCELDCKISYLNTSSLQFLGDIFFLVDSLKSKIPEEVISINWYYDFFDSDMKETGADFKDVVDVNFNLKEVKIT